MYLNTHRASSDRFSRPSRSSRPTRPSIHKFHGAWDTAAVARLVGENSGNGKSPAFLFLGREETELLRRHLGNAFGVESVTTLHQTYYMGLQVVTVDAEHYVATGGSKQVRVTHARDLRRVA
jgi:hypothetical protein